MSDLQTAAQQALEALEAALSDDQPYIERCKQTIAALRAALAEPVLAPAPGYCKHCKQYTIEEPLPAEPVQEPVAWVLSLPDGRLDRLSVVAYDDEAEEMLHRSIAGCTLVPLYPAPPQRPAEPVPVVDRCANCLRPKGEHQGDMCPRPYTTVWHAWDYEAKRAEPVQEPVQEMPSNTRYTVAVEGQAVTYWDNIHDAITNAQRAVYAGVDATIRAIDDLRAGRLAEWSYGFSAVRIYPPQQQVESVQEPVAKVELMMTGGNAGLATRIVEIDDHLRERLRPGQLLYTAPPQRNPLTEEQIIDATEHIDTSRNGYFTDIARAIEQAHGIK